MKVNDAADEPQVESIRKKTGGRQKGTPNKATAKVREVFENYGICPLTTILELSETLSTQEKIAVYFKLLPYLYPTRKAADATVLLDHNF